MDTLPTEPSVELSIDYEVLWNYFIPNLVVELSLSSRRIELLFFVIPFYFQSVLVHSANCV
jgi:hypothetical protein